MIEKLQIIQQRFDEVSDLIIQPNIISNQKRYIQLNKEYKDLSLMVEKIKVYNTLLSNLQEAELLLKNENDSEMIAMAKMEVESAKEQLPELEEEIKFLLIPKDPDDTKNVVIEIRAGTGGDEASIFAGDLYRMYTKYCQSKNWNVSFVDSSDGTSGGFKEVISSVNGNDIIKTKEIKKINIGKTIRALEEWWVKENFKPNKIECLKKLILLQRILRKNFGNQNLLKVFTIAYLQI